MIKTLVLQFEEFLPIIRLLTKTRRINVSNNDALFVFGGTKQCCGLGEVCSAFWFEIGLLYV